MMLLPHTPYLSKGRPDSISGGVPVDRNGCSKCLVMHQVSKNSWQAFKQANPDRHQATLSASGTAISTSNMTSDM